MSEIIDNKKTYYEYDVSTVPDPVEFNRSGTIYFDNKSNEVYRYDNSDNLLGTAEGKNTLKDMINIFFNLQKPRLEILLSYAKGVNHSILTGQRRLDKEKSDYRVRHKWGGYISSFVTNYVVGNPVTIGLVDGANKSQLDVIDEINWENDIDALNIELAFDSSIYGRAYEYHFRDKNNRNRIVLIDPKEMFIIRDMTVEQNIIAAIHLPVFNNEVHMTVYTDKEIVTFKPFSNYAVNIVETSRTKHSYNDVPVVEWSNNRFRQGDYESEISLIDAYDASQSDTANYMSDLNDAMLLIKGDLENLGLKPEDFKKMKDANMLLLQSGISVSGQQTNSDANYIYKQYDVNGTEAYKERLANDVHKFSKIPNLDDDRFNTTSSGIALLYKMIGLEQVRTDKENYFTKALKRRYELISNIHKFVNAPSLEADKLTFTFHPNLPQDVWTEIKAYIDSGGIISQETLLNNATFTDFATEQSRILKENGATDFELDNATGGVVDESDREE